MAGLETPKVLEHALAGKAVIAIPYLKEAPCQFALMNAVQEKHLLGAEQNGATPNT